MKITKSKLYLTDNELEVLFKASFLLEKIAKSMERAVSVPWCSFDDDEIMGAVDIIYDIMGNQD